MGPHERLEQMLSASADEGGQFSTAALEAMYTPVELDLGGGSPYQIVYSIVVEVLAVANDRTPRHLKTREGPSTTAWIRTPTSPRSRRR